MPDSESPQSAEAPAAAAPTTQFEKVILSPIEAELVRLAEARCRAQVQAAQQDRLKSLTPVLAAHAVPNGTQWSLQETPEGIALAWIVPASDATPPGPALVK